jgi:hypothetical protein
VHRGVELDELGTVVAARCPQLQAIAEVDPLRSHELDGNGEPPGGPPGNPEGTATGNTVRGLVIDRVTGVAMDDRVSRVQDLLHQAAETHHVVFRITDGADDDWASWYTTWLVDHSELPEILGSRPVPSELTWMLVQSDKDYSHQQPDEPWEHWYATRLVAHFTA